AGFTSASGVYEWSGEHWDLLGASGPGRYGRINSLTVYNGQLIAAGSFTSLGGTEADGLASWDGSTWHAIGAGEVHPLFGKVSVTPYGDRLLVSGSFYFGGRVVPLMTWDGANWNSVDGVNGRAEVAGVIGGRLFVSGYLRTDESPQGTSLAAFLGHRWYSLGSGVNGYVTSFAERDGALH